MDVVISERSREDPEIQIPYNRNTAHVECKKTKVIPVIIGATGTISKSFRQYLSNIQGKHEIEELYCVLMATFFDKIWSPLGPPNYKNVSINT